MQIPLPIRSGSFSISYHSPRYCNQRQAISPALNFVYSECKYLSVCAHLFNAEVGLHVGSRTGTPVKSLSRDHREQQDEKVDSRHFGSCRRLTRVSVMAAHSVCLFKLSTWCWNGPGSLGFTVRWREKVKALHLCRWPRFSFWATANQILSHLLFWCNKAFCRTRGTQCCSANIVIVASFKGKLLAKNIRLISSVYF